MREEIILFSKYLCYNNFTKCFDPENTGELREKIAIKGKSRTLRDCPL